jgi:polysaccharide deacetylase family protein (PEP-CTERM system associated)
VSHILTIDFEDWNQIAYRRATGELPPPTRNLERQIDQLLPLLAQHNARATFFALGLTAEQYPHLLRAISDAGHELASHGYAHLPVHQLSSQQFAADARRGKEMVEQISGCEVRGYRAAEFSIRSHTLWALEILAELGFEYDSSIVPARHRRYGIPGFSPLPARYMLAGGLTIAELPITVANAFGLPWLSGGGYFRLLPQSRINKFFSRLAPSQPAMTYFHPHEFDSERLKIFETARPQSLSAWFRAARFGFHQNLGRTTMPSKLHALLSRFNFSSCADFLKATELGAPDARRSCACSGGAR